MQQEITHDTFKSFKHYLNETIKRKEPKIKTQVKQSELKDENKKYEKYYINADSESPLLDILTIARLFDKVDDSTQSIFTDADLLKLVLRIDQEVHSFKNTKDMYQDSDVKKAIEASKYSDHKLKVCIAIFNDRYIKSYIEGISNDKLKKLEILFDAKS